MHRFPFLFSRKPYFYFMSKCTFGKSDRLASKQQIEQLFVEGNSFTEFPLKVIWRWTEGTGSTVQIVLSVPKKEITKSGSSKS